MDFNLQKVIIKIFMRGSIAYYNRTKGMFSILLESGEYSVLESLDSYEINIADEIIGDLENLGSMIIHNFTTGDSLSVIIQNVHCTQHQAINRVLLN